MMHFKMLMHALLGLFVVIGVGGFPLGKIPLASGDNENLCTIKNIQKMIGSTPINQFEEMKHFLLCFAFPTTFCESMEKEWRVVMVPTEQHVMKTVIACCKGYIFTNEELCVPVCENCACGKCTKPNVCDCDYGSDELDVTDTEEQYHGPNVVLAKKEFQLENDEKQPLISDEMNSKIMYYLYDPIDGGVQDNIPVDAQIVDAFIPLGMDQELDLEGAQHLQREFLPPLYDVRDLASVYDYYDQNEDLVPGYKQKNSPAIEDSSSTSDDIPDLNEAADGILIRVNRDTELHNENKTTLDFDDHEGYEYDTTMGMENNETTLLIGHDTKMAMENDATTPFFDEFADENNTKMAMGNHATTLFYEEIKGNQTKKAVVTQSNSTETSSRSVETFLSTILCHMVFTMMSMAIIILALVLCVKLYDMATKMFSKKENSTAGVEFSLLDKNRKINTSYMVYLNNLLETMTVEKKTGEEDDDVDTKKTENNGPEDKDEVQELDDENEGKVVTIIPEEVRATKFYDYTGDMCKLYKKPQYQ